MSNVRSHNVRHVQRHLAAVLAEVERGEEIEVLRRGRPVARMVPLPSESQPCDWSDASRRLQSAYPALVGGISAARIIAEGRGEQ